MKRNNYFAIAIVALFSVASIAIAYAALSQTLTITTNNVIQSTLEWNPRITTCSKTVDTGVGTSTTGRTCGAVTVPTSGTNAYKAVTVADITLSKPEDACIYKCTISNVKTGTPNTIGAKINSIVPTAPTSTTCGTTTSASSSASASMVCGNITYGIYASATVSGTTITTSNLTTGTAISSGATKDFYLVVKYSGTGINSTAVTQAGGKFTFTLGQN